MQINNTVAGELRAWGARYLGNTAALSEAEARAALLQRVQDEGCVPDRRAVSAYQLVAGSALVAPSGVQADGLADLEMQLRGELDDFARSFFMLDAAARRSRWLALKHRCDWLGPLNARLEHLRTGLSLEPARVAHADPLVARFADFLAELFVLRAGPRALRRQEILAEIDRDQASWKRAACVLESQWPRLAALDAHFLRMIAHPEAVEAERREARRRTHRAFESQAREPANQGSGSNWWIFVVIMVVAGFLRACMNNPPSNPPPRFQPNQNLVLPKDFKQPDIQKMFDRLRKENRQRPAPRDE